MTAGTIAERLAAGAPTVGVEAPARTTATDRQKVRSVPAASRISDWTRDAAREIGADVRSAWWTPTSLPTVQQAWADRMPDRERVPAGNAVLYRGWVVYNHTLALLVPALALLVVGVLTPLVWAARHPARLVLTAVIVTAFTALIF